MNINQAEAEKFSPRRGKRRVLTLEDDLYNVQNIEEVDPLTYIGSSESSGDWKMLKITASSATSQAFTYATIENNPTYTDYDTAWSSRASLTYQKFNQAFPV